MDLVSGALSFGRVAAVCEDVLAQHGALASPGLVELAASFYLQLLRELPALVRDWWSHKLPCPCMQTLITAPWPPHRCAKHACEGCPSCSSTSATLCATVAVSTGSCSPLRRI